jgi:hypothetical protein
LFAHAPVGCRWADKSFAVPLLRHEHLPGGWKLLELEHLQWQEGWRSLEQLQRELGWTLLA